MCARNFRTRTYGIILDTPDVVLSVNGGPSVLVDQPDSGGGNVVISVPVKLNLNNGANSITFGSGQSSEFPGTPFTRHGHPQKVETVLSDYAADLDKIIVY